MKVKMRKMPTVFAHETIGTSGRAVSNSYSIHPLALQPKSGLGLLL
jgi:hypothetical protein